MNNLLAKIPSKCLICGDDLSIGELFSCPQCDTPHHKDCWEYNGGCAVYSCNNNSLVIYEKKNLLARIWGWLKRKVFNRKRSKDLGKLLANAIHYKRYKLAESLIKSGADVNAYFFFKEINIYYRTPLTSAIINRNLVLVKRLVYAGARIDPFWTYNPISCENEQINFCLMQALVQSDTNIAKFLIDNGADIFVEYEGKNMIEIAQSHNHDDLVQYMVDSLALK